MKPVINLNKGVINNMFHLVKSTLVNKKYTQGSLYGSGIFPFWLYIKFFGKPLYKKARRYHIPAFFSLMIANIPGSLAHVSFSLHFNKWTILLFIMSLLIFPGLMWLNHKIK